MGKSALAALLLDICCLLNSQAAALTSEKCRYSSVKLCHCWRLPRCRCYGSRCNFHAALLLVRWPATSHTSHILCNAAAGSATHDGATRSIIAAGRGELQHVIMLPTPKLSVAPDGAELLLSILALQAAVLASLGQPPFTSCIHQVCSGGGGDRGAERGGGDGSRDGRGGELTGACQVPDHQRQLHKASCSRNVLCPAAPLPIIDGSGHKE